VFELSGYRAFVALRYLLIAEPKVTRRTKLALVILLPANITWSVIGTFGGSFSSGGGLYGIATFSAPFASVANFVTVALTLTFAVVVLVGVLRHSRPAMWAFLVGLGLAIGVTVAFLFSRLIAGILFNVPPTDPFTFAAVTALLVVVAICACVIPARRATSINPVIALRAN
jgi:hypothetical protein